MSRVVVDTNIVSFYFRDDTRFADYAPELDGKELVMSFMTLAELRYWQEIRNWGAKRRSALLRVIQEQYIIYPVHDALCGEWSSVTAEATRLGRKLQSSDAWLAATALHLGVPLISHDRKDFDYLLRLQLITKAPISKSGDQ